MTFLQEKNVFKKLCETKILEQRYHKTKKKKKIRHTIIISRTLWKSEIVLIILIQNYGYVISLMFQRLLLKGTSLCFPRKGQIYILKVKALDQLHLQVFCSLSKCFQLESSNQLTISDGKCSLLDLNVLGMTTRISWFLWEYDYSLFLHIVHSVCV